jgi:hypothetical protein
LKILVRAALRIILTMLTLILVGQEARLLGKTLVLSMGFMRRKVGPGLDSEELAWLEAVHTLR